MNKLRVVGVAVGFAVVLLGLVSCSSSVGTDLGAVLSSEALSSEALAGASSGAAEDGSAPEEVAFIPWNEAASYVGTTQRVCGPIASTGSFENAYFVNVGLPHPHPDRFQFVLWDLGSLPNLPIGAQACATAEIEPYEDTHEFRLSSIDQIELL